MKNRRNFIKSTSLLVASAGVFGYQGAYSVGRIVKTKKTKSMLHNVYFWLKETVSEKEKKAFEKGMMDFMNAVDEIEKFSIGVPAPTPDRDVVDHSFGYSLFVWFKNIENHNLYQAHPAHKKFIEDFSDLWAKVQVFDSEII